ncbi:MAG: arabinose efflux permease family protein [Bacteroidetes bacterium]|jgi:predicted MFS family arabinose efflux permease|nr:arabinose efflux permease family protein [Bacteroidota bacterium]
MSQASAIKTKQAFSKYQVFVIAILAILQFTVVLDFMVLSPLGEILLKKLSIDDDQFTGVVSAYGISAGISGFLTAAFADKFDRKKLLLFFYAGFIVGTLFCGLAPDYGSLMAARIFTGVFGGVLSSISFAIITDLFEMQQRGRVMGFVQMAFAASQVLGIPIGLYLANKFHWHVPFLMIVGFSAVVFVILVMKLKPVTDHLQLTDRPKPLQHMIKTISNRRYITGFLGTVLLATGGFMLMPLGAAFSVNNLKITNDQLTIVYFATGISSMIFGPLIGKLSDSLGKFRIFAIGSVITMIMVYIYTNLGATPLWQVITVNILLFAGVTSRMISAQALMSGVPAPRDRGAFMSVNSSIQYLSGGIASILAGKLVFQDKVTGEFQHYERIGYVVIASMIVCALMMWFINRMVNRKQPDLKTMVKQEAALTE